VPVANEEDVVLQIEKILSNLQRDRELLERLRQQGMRYARECLSWDGKAKVTSQILTWAVGQGPKPDLQPPRRCADKMLNGLVWRDSLPDGTLKGLPSA
jgi:hypothetical protein